MNVEKELRLRRRARALLEDISQIRSVLNAPKPPLGYARQISALMRRILFDDHDLRDVASAMIGKIQISTPDANPYRWLQNDTRTIVFVLGRVDLYNFSIGNISVFSGGRDLLADNDLSPDSWPRVTLPLDTFCKQNCLQYRGRVFSRRTVNKFVADTS